MLQKGSSRKGVPFAKDRMQQDTLARMAPARWVSLVAHAPNATSVLRREGDCRQPITFEKRCSATRNSVHIVTLIPSLTSSLTPDCDPAGWKSRTCVLAAENGDVPQRVWKP